jgi:hypothetical protein
MLGVWPSSLNLRRRKLTIPVLVGHRDAAGGGDDVHRFLAEIGSSR